MIKFLKLMDCVTNIIITLMLFTTTPKQIHTMYYKAAHSAAMSCMMMYK